MAEEDLEAIPSGRLPKTTAEWIMHLVGQLRSDIQNGFGNVQQSLAGKADQKDVTRIEGEISQIENRVTSLESDRRSSKAVRSSWHTILVTTLSCISAASSFAFLYEVLHK
jgi:hypothetical protein